AVAPRSKVIIGVPYYAPKACGGNPTRPNQDPTSSVVADSYLDASGEAAYFEVKTGSYAAHRETNSGGMERWDIWYNTRLGCTRELYWDDAVSLGKKYDLVNADGLRGVGLWNLNYGGGAPELWAALQNHFLGCSGAAISVSPASPQWASTHLTVTASPRPWRNPQYRFWLQSPGGKWAVAQNCGAAATYSWSAGVQGTYSLEVDVRDQGSTASYDKYVTASFTIYAPPCTTPSLRAVPASPQGSGTRVVFSASTGGCPNPRSRCGIEPP